MYHATPATPDMGAETYRAQVTNSLGEEICVVSDGSERESTARAKWIAAALNTFILRVPDHND